MCFFCDKNYYRGHKCASQVYRLEVVEEMGCEKGQEEDTEGSEGPVMHEDEQPLISLQALKGMNFLQTMRVTGKVGSQALHILVDFGSTHNFLDATTVKKLRCEL